MSQRSHLRAHLDMSIPAPLRGASCAEKTGCGWRLVGPRRTVRSPVLVDSVGYLVRKRPHMSMVSEDPPRESWTVAIEHERQTPTIAQSSPSPALATGCHIRWEPLTKGVGRDGDLA